MGKISIKNVSSATVVLTCENLRFRRELTPNRQINVDAETYEELAFEPGNQVLISNGFLKITTEKEEDKELIEDTSSTNYTVMSYDEVRKIYEDKDYSTFTKAIKDASQATKENFIKAAIDMNVVDNGFTALIKKYCNVDVIQAITLKRQTEI